MCQHTQGVVGSLITTLRYSLDTIVQWKIFWKPAKIWQNYGHEFGANFFGTRCTRVNYAISKLRCKMSAASETQHTAVNEQGSHWPQTPPPIGERSIVMSVSVCVRVCVCRRSYLRNCTSDFHHFFLACYLWPWLGPPLAAYWYVMYFRFYGWRHICSEARRRRPAEAQCTRSLGLGYRLCAVIPVVSQRTPKVTSKVATPGAESAVNDCLVHLQRCVEFQKRRSFCTVT